MFCGGRRWWKAEVFGQLRGKRKKSRGFSGAGDEGKKILKGEAVAGERERPGMKKMGLRCGGEKNSNRGEAAASFW